ncbi:30368_t:CDS:2, partial [Gigaspora margarita]
MDSSTRQIITSYQAKSPNNLASRMAFSRLQEDNRHKEGIYFKTKNSSIELGKVIKKGENRVFAEHWLTTKDQNTSTRTVNKCKGCSLNSVKDSQISPEMFGRSCINGIEIGNTESILQELKTIENLKIEMIKNRTKNLDIASDLINKLELELNLQKVKSHSDNIDHLVKTAIKDTTTSMVPIENRFLLRGALYWKEFLVELPT